MAKSKGHVSPVASERGNYPFPVREQQMIAECSGGGGGGWGGGGCIFRGWNLSLGKEGRSFNFLAAVYLLLSCFSRWSFVAHIFFSLSSFLPLFTRTHVEPLFLCTRAPEGVFMCSTLTYLFIVLHFLTVATPPPPFFWLWPFHRLYIVQVISLSASLFFFTFQRKQWMEGKLSQLLI